MKTTNCNPTLLTEFVARRLSEIQVADLEQHLSQCAGCRDALALQTADDDEWQNARLYLRDENDDLQSLSHLSDAEPAVRDDQYIIDRVLETLAPTDDPQYVGRIGEYEISGIIGCGGMGAVFKGFDRSLNRVVAIKVMAPHLASSGAARQRFAREAQAAAAMTHDNVIDIYGVSESGGLPYLVMPYARGPSLQKRIDSVGPLPLIEVLRIGRQIAAGLAAAHEQGLVHRDIKPANILLSDGIDRLLITDFGLARAVDDASVTRTGVIAGTPQYMSPEQARGDAIDHRSDLFSLGSVMYACCTGRPPFRADSAYGILRRITDNEPRAIREINPQLPDWLCRVVSKLHSKCREDRYQSASEVANLLAECIAHVQTPSTPLPAELQHRVRRSWPKVAWTSLVVVLIVSVVWWNWSVDDAPFFPIHMQPPLEPINETYLIWSIDDELAPDAIQARVKEIGAEIEALKM
jgi:serine/threonine protein kinase